MAKNTITVKSKGASFRRAGIRFTREGVTLDPAKLTKEQLAQIRNEPNLVASGDAEREAAEKAAAEKAAAEKAAAEKAAAEKAAAGKATK